MIVAGFDFLTLGGLKSIASIFMFSGNLSVVVNYKLPRHDKVSEGESVMSNAAIQAFLLEASLDLEFMCTATTGQMRCYYVIRLPLEDNSKILGNVRKGDGKNS